MSMLMERRRRKIKIWNLDTQGASWSKDNNKIGQKMLEKMGWTSGKGLGVNEQGITEHVRVKKRSSEFEKSGIGYNKAAMEKDIYGCYGNFDEILQQIEKVHERKAQELESSDEDSNEESLEAKSKQSSARLHYKKFIRGKDIKKYGSKDLASIFGKKDFTDDEVEIKNKKDESVPEEKTNSIKDNWAGVVTINSGNMTDYFKKKLQNHKKNSSANMTNNRTSDSNDIERRAGFGFACKSDNTSSTYGVAKDFGEKNNYTFDNPCLKVNSPTETELNVNNSFTKPSKKRKKESIPEGTDSHKKRRSIEIFNSNCKDGFSNPALNLDAEPNESCNGKEFEVSRVQLGVENCGLDLTDENSNKKRVTFNDHVEYTVDSAKKKKRKTTLDKFEVEIKSKKHKKKRIHEDIATPISNGFVNEALDIEILHEEINDNVLNEQQSRKIKKKKIRRASHLETIRESPEQEKETIESKTKSKVTTLNVELSAQDEIDVEIIEQKSQKKKKKKREKLEKISVDTKNEEEDVKIEEIISDKTIEIDKTNKTEAAICEIHKKKKKKDKKKDVLVIDITKTETNSDQQNDETLEKSNSEKQNNLIKKKKSKKHIFIENFEKIETLHLENTVRKKKKKSSSKHSESDCPKNESNLCNAEESISDKENTVEEKEPDIEILPKKKRSKQPKDVARETSPNPNVEVANENVTQENIKEFDRTSKKDETSDIVNSLMQSPWNARVRMSKRMLKALFCRNLIADFPGSNIHEIKGYGVEYDSN